MKKALISKNFEKRKSPFLHGITNVHSTVVMVVVLPKSCCSPLSYDGHTYRSQDLPVIGNGHKPNHVHLLEDSNIGDLDLDSNSNVTDVGYLLKKAM